MLFHQRAPTSMAIYDGAFLRLLRWPDAAAYLVPFVLASGLLLRLESLRRSVARAQALAARGKPFERRLVATGPRVLILGDSTGVGIGADRPEESIAGLLASDFPDADVVNVSKSGARVADALAQARECLRAGQHFDVALLHVGGNDVMRATPTRKLAEDCRLLLSELAILAHRTVWLGPPNIGVVPLFPPPFSWLFAARSRAASALFARCAAEHGVAFVDFSSGEHAARFTPRGDHFAADGLHPNSSSYSYGYAAARRVIGPLAGEGGSAAAVAS
jgi:lysophospholipase L1-like esterase